MILIFCSPVGALSKRVVEDTLFDLNLLCQLKSWIVFGRTLEGYLGHVHRGDEVDLGVLLTNPIVALVRV